MSRGRAVASGTWPPGPGAGAGNPGPGRPWPRLDGAAQLVLLAGAARLPRPRGAAGPGPGRLAQLAEDLAQLVVDLLQDGGPLSEVDVLKRGEPADGRVDARVTGGGQSRPNSF
jgi:hypothetical protein